MIQPKSKNKYGIKTIIRSVIFISYSQKPHLKPSSNNKNVHVNLSWAKYFFLFFFVVVVLHFIRSLSDL